MSQREGRIGETNRDLNGRGRRVALIVSRFNPDITVPMADAARESLLEHGISQYSIKEISVPGAFELPVAALTTADDVDGVICLGCVIRGETPHFDYICQATAQGVQDVAVKTGKPIAFGVLTCETYDQASARSGPDEHNKGREAAEAVLEMMNVLEDARA